MKIKQLPISERPYEKLELYGPSKLTDSELLAIILKSGTQGLTSVGVAQEVLAKNTAYNKGLEFLNDLSLYELQTIKGIGKVKAIQLKALGELLNRKSDIKNIKTIKILTPSDVSEVIMDKLQNEEFENIVLMLLHSNNSIMRIETIAKGGKDFSNFSITQILSLCMRNNCEKVILIHNHPSGDSSPSKIDVDNTKIIDKKLKEFNIQLLDHIVIGKNQYSSIKNYINTNDL